ncbi:MAG: hypothetical protein HYT79_07060 [Elusimicrobia bacterium]|nr:hypothetical protein [Elusimicrobiota bacterium]
MTKTLIACLLTSLVSTRACFALERRIEIDDWRVLSSAMDARHLKAKEPASTPVRISAWSPSSPSYRSGEFKPDQSRKKAPLWQRVTEPVGGGLAAGLSVGLFTHYVIRHPHVSMAPIAGAAGGMVGFCAAAIHGEYRNRIHPALSFAVAVAAPTMSAGLLVALRGMPELIPLTGIVAGSAALIGAGAVEITRRLTNQ